jgi:hypothetical protein
MKTQIFLPCSTRQREKGSQSFRKTLNLNRPALTSRPSCSRFFTSAPSCREWGVTKNVLVLPIQGVVKPPSHQNARGGDYGQNPSFTMSISKARALSHTAILCIWSLPWNGEWWSQTGSNRRPEACKATALPTELWPRRKRRTWKCSPKAGGPGKT